MDALARTPSRAMSGPGFFTDALFPALIRVLTVTLIVALCVWMGAGIVRILLDIQEVFTQDWTTSAKHTILNALIVLALLEVIRTLQVYLQLGRVRVTFILDTALVVLITKLMGLWFWEYTPEKVLLGLGVIVILVILRLVTARFSPDSHL